MILRTLHDTTFITLQTDHAVASGKVAGLLDNRFLEPKLRDQVIAATANHDEGWREWETNPRLHSDGRPVNFTEISPLESLQNWRRGIEWAEQHLGAYPAALITRHAQVLASEDFEEAQDYYSDAILRLQKLAFPDDDPMVREWYIERGFYVLKFCDVATLIPAAGWPGPVSTTLLDEDGRHVECSLTRRGDWDVEVSNWPFRGPGPLSIIMQQKTLGGDSLTRKVQLLPGS